MIRRLAPDLQSEGLIRSRKRKDRARDLGRLASSFGIGFGSPGGIGWDGLNAAAASCGGGHWAWLALGSVSSTAATAVCAWLHCCCELQAGRQPGRGVPTIFRKSKRDSDRLPFPRNVIVLPDSPGTRHAGRDPTCLTYCISLSMFQALFSCSKIL